MATFEWGLIHDCRKYATFASSVYLMLIISCQKENMMLVLEKYV